MSEMHSVPDPSENMAVCGRCGCKLRPDARFCLACGHPVPAAPANVFCSGCGAQLREGEMFCHNCGAPTAQNRDREALDGIAAYNRSVGAGKKEPAAPLRLKKLSLFSLLSWLATAVFAAGLTVRLTHEISYAYTLGDVLTQNGIFRILAILAFVLSTATGVLLWSGEKKTRIVPVLAMTAGAAFTLLCNPAGGDMRVWIGTITVYAAALLMGAGVVRTRLPLLLTSLGALFFSVVFSLLSRRALPCILAIPPFLLTFSFTSGEGKEPAKKKMLLTRFASFALAFLLMLGGAGLGLYESWVYVGDIANTDVYAAKVKYQRLNVRTKYAFSEASEDRVIDQSIEKGSFVHPDSSLTLTVSKGPGVQVPDVAGLPLAEAQKALEDLGLTVRTIYGYSDSVGKDHVVRVSNDHVDEGAVVTLTVSKGPDTRVEVPDVTNLTESQAKEALQALGFDVQVENVYKLCDAYTNTTKVTFQSLTGKQEAGSTVTIEVTRPSIAITGVSFDHNFLGGVDLDIGFKNLSGKTIKYITFFPRFKNAVGDDVYCTIAHVNIRPVYYTGPLDAGSSDRASWSAVIYNQDCRQIHFDNIQVEFMDGTYQNMTYSGYWY